MDRVAEGLQSGQELIGPRRYVLGDLLKAFGVYAEQIWKARTEGRQPGPRIGLPLMDAEIAGSFSVGKHAITGDTGAGKTAFALQVAVDCTFPALYVTCEMAPLELFRRIIARTTSTYLGKLKTGELHPSEMTRLAAKAAQRAPELAILDARDHAADPVCIYEQAEMTQGEADTVLVVIDSLHSWVDSQGFNASEYERLNAGLQSLTSLAAQLNCPVLFLAERNRAMKAQGGTSSGAGTRKIEYGSETQIDLNRETEGSAGLYDILATFAKNRNGAPGRKIRLRFDGGRQEFSEIGAVQ